MCVCVCVCVCVFSAIFYKGDNFCSSVCVCGRGGGVRGSGRIATNKLVWQRFVFRMCLYIK